MLRRHESGFRAVAAGVSGVVSGVEVGPIRSFIPAFRYGYDAFETVSRWIETEPETASLRALRASLLDQVGLAGIERAAR